MYTVKIKGEKRIIEGSYIPKGHDCQCKSCKFTIEVPVNTNDKEIELLVNKIKTL